MKEKVVEDEKKSGIGSLFDDEKSSFQHISLLKQKYQKMRRDYDKKMDELNKLKLKVIGEQFVLDSQINVMVTQNNKVKENIAENDQFFKKRLFEIDRDLKDSNNHRINAENELRMHDNELLKEQANNYNYKMTLVQGKANDELTVARHALEVEFQQNLIEEKEKVIQKFTDDRNDVKAKIQGLADYQKGLAEEASLREEIFNAGVDLEMKQIKVKELEDVNEYLNQKKDELTDARRSAEEKNEKLRAE